jgi:hypothetical protein
LGHNKSKFKYKLSHYYGKDHSILNLNLDEFFDKLRSIFEQYKSKLGEYKTPIWQKKVNLLDSRWWLFQLKKLNFGYERVKIGTVLDNFWTLQVKYGTVQDKDSTKSGEIFGQYMMNFSTN